MTRLHLYLFGRLKWRYAEQLLPDLESSKARELLCYLALHRDQPQAREVLASRLWGDRCTTAQSRKYLRNSLWQLQTALNRLEDRAVCDLLVADPDWIEMRSGAALWLDVAAFEEAYAASRDVPGRDLEAAQSKSLEEAVQLHTGDLLEGWNSEWCLYERERLLHIYLHILDGLMEHAEARGSYELGFSYGDRILQCDRAREHTHQRLMRLHHLAGDRTGALRQFERCVEALEEELNVAPGGITIRLYEDIRGDRPIDATPSYAARSKEGAPSANVSSSSVSTVRDIVVSLQRLQASLAATQVQIQNAIWAAEASPEIAPRLETDQQTSNSTSPF
jgi:DNA-binding SARP family transcriptional activator